MANKNKKNHKLAVLDFETDPFKFGREPKPFAGGVWDGEVYRQFWGSDCVENIVEYIREELQGYTIYAHNGGKFDYFFMLKHLDEKIKLINGRISKATIGTAELRDSYNILPLPLSAHKKDKFDYSKMEPVSREKHKEEILKYLKNDCLYLFDWVKKFIDRFGKRLTVAGTAFNELKKTGYAPQGTNQYYDETFRKFYYGGRVETFQSGEILGDHVYIDINSAYPWAMLDEHPFGSKYIEKLKLPGHGWGGYFAKINAVSRGALPSRCPDTKQLRFYNDDIARDYFVTGWEINSGIKTGTLDIKKVYRVYEHQQTKNFKKFVDKFYSEKLEAKKNNDKDNETFSKLMLNSCYGKFGQDGREFKDFMITPAHCVPGDFVISSEQKEGEHYWSLYAEHKISAEHLDNAGLEIWQKPAPVDRFYNVATAASITGRVRAFMWESICASEEPVYCDTDSIMCRKFHGEIGSDLGQWKVEANLDKLYIGGKKFYAVHDVDNDEYKTACKGARLTSEQIVNEVKTGDGFLWKKDAPSFSMRFGQRFLQRKISRQF